MAIIGIILGVLAVLGIGWLWLVAPGRGGDFTELAKFDYAHRGLHDLEQGVPENSAAAFARAVERGYGVELDIQLTRDGRVVVHHDRTLKRSCGDEAAVESLTLEELQARRLFGTEQRVPTFAEVLGIIGGKTPIIVELKGYNDVDRLCTLAMEELADYPGLYCVESFDPRIVRWFRKNRPEIVRGQLMYAMHAGEIVHGKPLGRFRAFCARNLLTNCLTRPHFEAYDISAHGTKRLLSLGLAKRICGMQEVSWTIRSWEAYTQAREELHSLRIFEKITPGKLED